MYEEQTYPLQTYSQEWHTRPSGTTQETVRCCLTLADEAGADCFSLLLLASHEEGRRLVPVFDSDFPCISDLSKAASYRSAEPLARMAIDGPCPIWWAGDDASPRLCPEARGWAREVPAPFEGQAGIAFPVSLECGRSGLFVFTGDDIELDIESLCEMHSRCFTLFAEVVRLRFQSGAKTQQLSKREVECLRLTADGLTSEDIASALGLSVHTANQYLSNTAHKLNAVNRVHAVAKALRGGLIE
jgi:DNA-binding CsgD family transcriptional regulator